jgi:prepilin-type N-terminal cleavage/methylation domain-containing protein
VSPAVRHRFRPARRGSERGFSLIELLIVAGLVVVVSAIGFPLLSTVRERLRLSQGMREVEREIHQARQRAVTNNRAMRIHFNCPAAGQYRVVELIGSVSAHAAADDAADRCSPTAYPFPPADDRVLARRQRAHRHRRDALGPAAGDRHRLVGDPHHLRHRRHPLHPHGLSHGERHWQNPDSAAAVAPAGSRWSR